MMLRGSFVEQTAAEKEKRVNMENKKKRAGSITRGWS